MKKGHQKFCVLPRDKDLYNFRKRGQSSIVERDIGLEYPLLVASNFHISTTLSQPLWKNVNDSKSYILAVPMIMSFKVLKYFFSSKKSCFLFAWLWLQDLKPEKMFFFFRNLDQHNGRLFHKKNNVLWPEGICLIWKLMEHTNDHKPDASIIPIF